MDRKLKSTLEKMLENASNPNEILTACAPEVGKTGGIKVKLKEKDYWLNRGLERNPVIHLIEKAIKADNYLRTYFYDGLIEAYSGKLSHGFCPTHFQELYGDSIED